MHAWCPQCHKLSADQGISLSYKWTLSIFEPEKDDEGCVDPDGSKWLDEHKVIDKSPFERVKNKSNCDYPEPPVHDNKDSCLKNESSILVCGGEANRFRSIFRQFPARFKKVAKPKDRLIWIGTYYEDQISNFQGLTHISHNIKPHKRTRRSSNSESDLQNNQGRLKNFDLKDVKSAYAFQYYKLLLKPEYLLYGDDQPFFVLKKNRLLKAGKKYRINYEVKRSGKPIANGEMFFKTSEGPVEGQCHLMIFNGQYFEFVKKNSEVSGVELTTRFQLFCKNWENTVSED